MSKARKSGAASPPEGAGARGVAKVDRLGPGAWVEAARDNLIVGGEARVKIEPLARTIGVTTGSFYWHFKDRQELLDALLQHWETHNSRAMFEAVTSERDARRQFERLVQVWLDERDYDPAYDAAVRDWARTSPKVAAAVRRVDEQRIELLHDIFRRLGYLEPDALVRARITYFHQVGYYALHISETPEERRRLLPSYIAILRGDA